MELGEGLDGRRSILLSLGWKRCLKADGKDLTEGRRGVRSQAQMEGLGFDRKRCLTPLDQGEEGEDVQMQMCSLIWKGKARELLFGSSDFTSEREKIREEEDVELGVVGGLRRLRKWAEAKEAAIRTTVSSVRI